MRLIDADALLEKKFETYDYEDPVEVVEVCDIEESPTIEAEPVRQGAQKTLKNDLQQCIYSFDRMKKRRNRNCR